MIYKYLLILVCLLFNFAQCAQLGEYRYSKYIGLQQQLINQRNNAIMRQRRYYKSPTRNIKYPTSNNPYPNIQNISSRQISPQYRYSASYYQNNY